MWILILIEWLAGKIICIYGDIYVYSSFRVRSFRICCGWLGKKAYVSIFKAGSRTFQDYSMIFAFLDNALRDYNSVCNSSYESDTIYLFHFIARDSENVIGSNLFSSSME